MRTPRMSRIDFEMIAAILHARKTDRDCGPAFKEWRDTVLTFASELSATNAHFDRDRFLRACELGGTGRATKNSPAGTL